VSNPNEILAHVNTTGLVASLVNGMVDVLGVIVVNIDGNTAELNITARVPIDTLTDLLKERIAAYLGEGFTADDITIEYSKKRANTNEFLGTATITVGADSSFAFGTTRVSFLGCLLLAISSLLIELY
jgi:hypothetical protein